MMRIVHKESTPGSIHVFLVASFAISAYNNTVHGQDVTRARASEVGNQFHLPGNISNNAYNAFYLSHPRDEREWNSQHGDAEDVVFKHGSVQNTWLPKAANDAQSEYLQFHHDKYADRISFDFAYGSFLSYDIRTPSVTSSNEAVADPKVVEFQVDATEHSGTFSIIYDCKHRPNDEDTKNVTVSAIVPVVSGLSVFFAFSKSCGGGLHELMEFGYFEASSVSQSDEHRIPFVDGTTQRNVGSHVSSTKVYVRLHKPAMSQEFFHVIANTSNNGLSLQTRGPTFGGVLKSEETSVIHILYDCHGSGKSSVQITVPIHPFKALSALWIKDCGGGQAIGLSVGSTESLKNDVVYKATTAEEWSLALSTTSPRIDSTAPVVNETVRFRDFWLSNDAAPVLVEPAVITVETPAVLGAVAARQLASPSRSDSGHLLGTGASFCLRVRLICKRKGTSLVTIGFPIKSFSNVQFGFVKKCNAPKHWVQSGFLRTANSAMVALSFVLVGMFACCYIPRKSTRTLYTKLRNG